MIQSIFSRSRSDLQLLYHSRFATRKSSVLLNSLPKSGTHFFKAIMQGMGYEFCGHLGSRSVMSVNLNPGSKGFYTAHTRKLVAGDGLKLLSVRDPAAVALSTAHYVKNRKDHYLNKIYRNKSIEEAMVEILEGGEHVNALVQRYQSVLFWAEHCGASTLDFDDVRDNPGLMAQVLRTGDVDDNAVGDQLQKWNPTKRDSDKKSESAFLLEFREKHHSLVQPCYDIYNRMKALRAYDI